MRFRNLIANYSAALVGVAAPLISLPLILDIIGIRLWGLVAILVTVQMMVGFLDAGLSQIMTREIANHYKEGCGQSDKFKIFYFSFFNLYILIAILLLLLGVVFSATLIEYFFNIPNELVFQAKLTGCVAILMSSIQLSSSMSRSLLVAAGKHSYVAIASVISVSCRTFIGYIVLLKLPSLESLLACYCIGTALEATCRWYYSSKLLETNHVYLISYKELEKHAATAGILTLSVGISLTAGQLDKLFIGHYLSLEDLGVYNIATTIAMGALQAYYPLMITLSPEFFKKKNNSETKALIRGVFFIVIKMLVLAWVVYILTGKYAIHLWLRNNELSQSVYYLTIILLVGVSINSIYNIIYTQLISRRATGSIFNINFVAFLVISVAAPLLIKQFGLSGAALAWSTMQLMMLVFGVIYIRKHLDG